MVRANGKYQRRWTWTVLFLLMAWIARATPEDSRKSYTSFTGKEALQELLAEAKSLSLQGYHDSSLKLYRHILERSILIHYQYGIARSMINIGNAAAHLNNTTLAMDYFNGALNYCDTVGATKGLIAAIYNNKANIYYLWGENERAVKMLMNARHYANRFPSEISRSSIYINLSNILNLMGRHEQALVFLDTAETIAINTGDPVALANSYHGKGSTYQSLGNWEAAKRYTLKALQVGRENGYNDIAYSAISNLGTIALGEGHPREAINFIKQADSLDSDVSPYYKINALNLLTRAYLALNEFEVAEAYTQEAIRLAKQFNSTRNLLETYQLMHELYYEKGNYQQAYKHLLQEKLISDSLTKEQSANAMEQLQLKYRSAKRDQELAETMLLVSRQQAEIKMRNIWIWISVSGLSIATLIIILLRRNYKHKQAYERERVQLLLRQQALNEMKAVIDTEERERSRIARDLHDGIMIQFSTVKMNLSTLLGTSGEVIQKEALRPYIAQLDHATQSLRRAAHHLMPDMLLEEGLAEAVYYFLNNLKKEVPFTITYEQMDNIPRFAVQFELAVYRIVQELIQNIIKHAQATEAYVQLSYSEGQLGIDVEDNGIGLPSADQRKRAQGSGLKSIESRMNTLNGTMRIQSNERGTSVSLEFNTDAHPFIA